MTGEEGGSVRVFLLCEKKICNNTTKHNLLLLVFTFSLSVPISFLSSLFFSLPGASAMGREV